MERISAFQLFALTVLYQIGTTIIFGFGATAGRAAWITVLISAALGLLINFLYLMLMRMNPGLTLVQWFPAQFGKWLGTAVAWMYPLQLLYVAGRIIGDLTILIPTTLLPKTPSLVTMSLFLLIVAYALFEGIEVLGRLGEVLLSIIFILYFLEVIFILSSRIINIRNIKPYLGKGWESIWKTVWPLGITQTFGQTIEFAMIWPLVKQQDKIIKTTLTATIITGLFISSLDLFAVMVLGESIFVRSIIPMFTLIGMVQVGDFIQNLDVINVISFMITAFFKISIHLFSAIRGIQQLTVIKNSRVLIFPSVIIALYLGINMASNTAEHIEAGLSILPYNLWILLFFILPVTLMIVTLIRNRYRSKVY